MFGYFLIFFGVSRQDDHHFSSFFQMFGDVCTWPVPGLPDPGLRLGAARLPAAAARLPHPCRGGRNDPAGRHEMVVIMSNYVVILGIST